MRSSATMSMFTASDCTYISFFGSLKHRISTRRSKLRIQLDLVWGRWGLGQSYSIREARPSREKGTNGKHSIVKNVYSDVGIKREGLVISNARALICVSAKHDYTPSWSNLFCSKSLDMSLYLSKSTKFTLSELLRLALAFCDSCRRMSWNKNHGVFSQGDELRMVFWL